MGFFLIGLGVSIINVSALYSWAAAFTLTSLAVGLILVGASMVN